MPCFKRCCCCVNLRVGGMMMGIMTLALSVFSIVPMALSLVNRVSLARVIIHLEDEYVNTDGEEGNDINSVAFWGVVGDVFKGKEQPIDDSQDDRVDWLASVMYIFFIICIVILVVYFLFSCFLIYGAAKGKRWFMLPWIVSTLLLLLAYLGGMAMSMWYVGGGFLALLLFAIAFIECCIGFYLWLCVVSLFQILGSDEWRNRDTWEMKPRFSTKYNGVPTRDD